MQELISERTANLIMNVLAVAGPLAGFAAGIIIGRLRGMVTQHVIKGLAIGSLAIVNLALWRIYNAVTDVLGIDTVANLLAQLGMFIVIGIVAGLLYITFFVRAKQT